MIDRHLPSMVRKTVKTINLGSHASILIVSNILIRVIDFQLKLVIFLILQIKGVIDTLIAEMKSIEKPP